MFCKYCGNELAEDALFCQYCGKPVKGKKILQSGTSGEKELRDETSQSPDIDHLREELRSILFLILTALLTLYFFLRLMGGRSLLTFLLMIPTIFICTGCWIVFIKVCRGKSFVTGLTLISGGLRAKIYAILAACLVAAVVSVISFSGFLKNFHAILKRSGTQSNLILAVLAFGVLVAACIVILLICFRRIRSGVLLVKKILTESAVSLPSVSSSGILRFTVATGVCTAFLLGFASRFYFLFYFLLYPGMAVTDELFGSSGNGIIRSILNQLINSYQNANSSSLNHLKDVLLKSSSVNVIQTISALTFLAILACIVLFILRFRGLHSVHQK